MTGRERVQTRWWRAIGLIGGALSLAASARPPVARDSAALTDSPRRSGEGRAGELVKGVPQLLRPQQPRQSLALSRYRFAVLQGNVVHVFRLRDLTQVAEFSVEGAKNLVRLTGGSFLVAGSETTARISPLGLGPRRFPALPLIGPTMVFASSQRSQRLLASFEGIESLAEFDLERVAPGVLPVIGWRRAVGFDSRAVLQLTDGSLVYTAEGGLVHLAKGRVARSLPVEALQGVWALARAREYNEVWAYDRFHAARIAISGALPQVQERRVLPRHPVAVASSRGLWAVLSIETQTARTVRFRVQVRETNTDKRWTVRWEEHMSRPAVEGSPESFRPELALSPRGRWVAVRAIGVALIDYEKGSVRAFPTFTGNLAQPEG